MDCVTESGDGTGWADVLDVFAALFDAPLAVLGTRQVTWVGLMYLVTAEAPATAHCDTAVNPVPVIVMMLALFVGASTGLSDVMVAGPPEFTTEVTEGG